MCIFQYGQKEIDYLKKRDKVLGRAIDEIGIIRRPVIPPICLRPLYGISWGSTDLLPRPPILYGIECLDRYSPITPETIMAITAEEMQKCGMSNRKANYIKGIAEAVVQGKLNLSELEHLPDDEVIKRLSSLPGIGV